MFMVIAKIVDEIHYQHVENVVALICGGLLLIVCAICLAYLLERRISEWEERKRLQLEIRLQRLQNEVDRERIGFRSFYNELQSTVEKQTKVIYEKNNKIHDLEMKCADYERQLDEVKIGQLDGRSLNHGKDM